MRPVDRSLRVAAYVAGLTAIYAAVLVSLHVWDLIIGAAIAAALLWLFRPFIFVGPPLPAGETLKRAAMFPVFAAVVIRDIMVGTWLVALVVLGLRPLRSPGIVAVPIGDRSPVGVVVSAIATTLSPGTFLVDIDWADRVMLIHSIDASDPDRIRQAFQHSYDRYQRHVFP